MNDGRATLETSLAIGKRGALSRVFGSRKTWEYIGNALLFLSALLFTINMLADFNRHHRFSTLYVALFEAAVVLFSVTRPMPKETNRSTYDWLIALIGSYLILLLRPATHVHDLVPLLALQLFGMVVSLTGLLSLNRSFGLVAANRGVKTRGMYRVVRHPIYAGYFSVLRLLSGPELHNVQCGSLLFIRVGRAAADIGGGARSVTRYRLY